MPLRPVPDAIVKELTARDRVLRMSTGTGASQPIKRQPNYISTDIQLESDKAVARIVMNVVGETPLYIQYDEHQLAGLIELLQSRWRDLNTLNGHIKAAMMKKDNVNVGQ